MRNIKIEKDFEAGGCRCVIVGQAYGHRCGYIGLPKGHPLYGKDYGDIDISVHGGLTYSGDGNKKYPVPSDDLWWIGFDTGHYGDGRDPELIKELASPEEYKVYTQMEKMFPTNEHGTIRTQKYVEQELISAVEQLKLL